MSAIETCVLVARDRSAPVQYALVGLVVEDDRAALDAELGGSVETETETLGQASLHRHDLQILSGQV